MENGARGWKVVKKKKAPEMSLFEGSKKVARAHFWGVILGPFQKSIFSFFWGSQNLDFPSFGVISNRNSCIFW